MNSKLIESWHEAAKTRGIPRTVYYSNVDRLMFALKIPAPPFFMWHPFAAFTFVWILGALMWCVPMQLLEPIPNGIQQYFVGGLWVGGGIASVSTFFFKKIQKQYKIASWKEFKNRVD